MARAAILFFALVLLALMSRWVADLIAPQPVVSKPVRHTPDFYLTQVQAWAMDEQGKLQHRMNAERITHFGDDNSVELTQPLFFSSMVIDPPGRSPPGAATVMPQVMFSTSLDLSLLSPRGPS